MPTFEEAYYKIEKSSEIFYLMNGVENGLRNLKLMSLA